jgi:hypothetical protein
MAAAVNRQLGIKLVLAAKWIGLSSYLMLIPGSHPLFFTPSHSVLPERHSQLDRFLSPSLIFPSLVLLAAASQPVSQTG